MNKELNIKINKKIWKDIKEFTKMYDIFCNTPKRKKKNCTIKISNAKWASLSWHHRYITWIRKKRKKVKVNNKYTNNINYKNYLKSNAWKDKRKYFIIKYKNICQCCKWEFLDKDLNVHHHTYTRIWKELDDDLTLVCLKCHYNIHFRNWKKVKLKEIVLRNSFKREKQRYKILFI